jgi:diguanylate cyclase (GGDEF)-like protein
MIVSLASYRCDERFASYAGHHVGEFVEERSIETMASEPNDDIQKLAELLALAIRLDPPLYQKVMELATRDQRSGAVSSDLIEGGLKSDLGRARLFGYALSVLILMIEPLKKINVSMLSLLDDRAKKLVVIKLRSLLRETDWIAAYPGDRQLLVVMPGCPARHLSLVAEKIQEATQNLTLDLPEEIETPLGVSLAGVVIPDGNATVQEVLDNLERVAERSKSADGGEPVIVELLHGRETK